MKWVPITNWIDNIREWTKMKDYAVSSNEMQRTGTAGGTWHILFLHTRRTEYNIIPNEWVDVVDDTLLTTNADESICYTDT